jgi:hypothetical protein
MGTLLWLFRVFIYSWLVVLIINALDIFAVTRDWSYLVIVLVLYVVIYLIFKILKKTIEEQD